MGPSGALSSFWRMLGGRAQRRQDARRGPRRPLVALGEVDSPGSLPRTVPTVPRGAGNRPKTTGRIALAGRRPPSEAHHHEEEPDAHDQET